MPTTEQNRARELVSLIHGTNLTCQMQGRDYVVTTEQGQTYKIDPHAECIRGAGRPKRLSDLETELDAQEMLRQDLDRREEDCDELYEEIYAREATDFDADRYADFVREADRIAHDRAYYNQLGEAA